MTEPTLDDVFLPSPRIVARAVGGDFVLVPLASHAAVVDSIYWLNETAAFVWQQLDGVRDGHRVVAEVVARFEVEPARGEADYLKLVGDLLSLEALERRR
ncbi:MAG TPA: PqqD family protein [Vicinamibacteria bacterium]|nr:PqqD family protein [Vicinamibacteria bacterium]